MTPMAAFPQPVRRSPWTLWATLLAMLLALQASAGAIRPPALGESGAAAAKLTLPAPLAAQLRESGQVLKAAAQRLNAAKPHDDHDAAPPLPAHAGFAASAAAGPPAYRFRDDTPRGTAGTGAYRARAPPRLA